MRHVAGIRRVWRGAGRRLAPLRTYLSYPLIRHRRGRGFIEWEERGERTLDGERGVVVFVHYDPHGHVCDYVAFYLRALRDAGYEIVFVSNAPRLSADAVSRLRPLCAAILRRRNIGYDFGAYRDGLAYLGDASRFETVILANDSVYGPLFDLRPILDRCDGSAAVWGMTDNPHGGWHLQTYFILVRRDALRSAAFKTFWNRMLPAQSKNWVISRHEIGFSQAMTRAGLRCAALYPYRDASARMLEAWRRDQAGIHESERAYRREVTRKIAQGRALNPTHHFFEHLIRRERFPFIKRELIERNPTGVANVEEWECIIRESSDYDTTMIARRRAR